MADWSSIPYELVCLVAVKLPTVEDYAALTAVCRSYRSATKGEKRRPEKVSQPPWLLLSCLDEEGGENPERGLLSMYRNRNKFLMNLPELHGRRCWGSPYGWIITLGLDRNLHFFNPLNRRRIALPVSAYANHDDDVFVRGTFIDRATLIKRPVFSHASDDDDFVLVTSCVLGSFRVMRPGGGWADVTCPMGGEVLDVICYKGQIYALSIRGRLLICHNFFDGPDPPTCEEFVPSDDERFEGNEIEKFYIVESLGELVLLVRHRDFEPPFTTLGFEAFTLDFETRKWIEIEDDDLGDRAFFVGACQTISVSPAEDFNCRRNCIYYTDDNYELNLGHEFGQDMGIYDFKEDRIESLYEGDGSRSTYSTPTWFIPTFT